MTIRRLDKPCFVLDPPPWDEDERGAEHYETRDAAEAVLAGERANAGPDDQEEQAQAAAARVRQLDAPCWVAECDAPEDASGTCGNTLGDEEEGPSCVHFETPDELFDWMPGEGWTRAGADGALCYDHRPEDAEMPAPPSPAEQEAAGQLVLPGVIR